MPQQTTEQDRLQTLARKITETETELAIVDRDIDQAKLELERLGITDIENAGPMMTKIKNRIRKFNERISALTTKAENLISRFERGGV